MRRGLLLDVGVVLLRSAWELADEYERLRGVPAGTVPGRGPFDAGGDARWQRHLAGELTERDYWLSFADAAVARGAPLDGHPHLMRAMFQTPGIDPERPQAAALIADARAAGVRLGLLTNELMSFQGRAWVERQPWFAPMEVVIDADETGIRKPDRRAYLLAVEAMALPPGDIVFVDDNPRYHEAALELGLRSVLLDVLDPDAAFAEARRLLGLA